MGGRRVLAFSVEFLIALLKAHDSMPRAFTVQNSLPDDARVVDGRIAWTRANLVEVVLESAEWQDERALCPEDLQPPTVILHWGTEAILQQESTP